MKAIIFDFLKTLWDKETGIYKGVNQLLEELSKNYLLFLISKTKNKEQRIKEIGELKNFFKQIIIVENKTPEIFLKLIKQNKLEKKDVYVIGDNLVSEIKIAKLLKLKAVWIKKNTINNMKNIKPDFIVTNILEIKNILN